jgi:hypothetical protein
MTATTERLTLAVVLLLAACASRPVTFGAPEGSVAGVLRDTTGTPLDEASIRLRPRGSVADLQCALTDSLGRFAFTAVTPGAYDVFLVVPAATALQGDNPRPVTVIANQRAEVELAVTLLPVSFARHVAPVLRGACTGCHSSAGGAPLGLRLTEGSARALTVGVPSIEYAGMKRIEPLKPDSSYLIYKLEGRQVAVGGSGVQMPQGFPPLPRQTIRMIGRWIAQGAPQN